MPVTARPTTLAEAFDALDERPDAQLLAGGTDFMVEVNFGHRRPSAVVALRRVAAQFPAEVNTVALRVDPASPVGISAATSLPVLTMRELSDLPALLRTGGPQ